MKGYYYIIDPVHGQQATCELATPITLDILQAAVGGSIETVPYFNTAFGVANAPSEMDIPRISNAIAFCNEEGKITGLTYNKFAQDQWYNAMALQTGRDVSEVMLNATDVLVGPIVVVWGDEEFMEAL